MQKISIEDLLQQDKTQYHILDVRSAGEYAEGYIEGANNVDVMRHGDFLEKIKELPRDLNYLVYCRTNNRSAYALEIMEREGFTNVTLLDGGYTAWEARC